MFALAALLVVSMWGFAADNEAAAQTNAQCRATGEPVADKPWIKVANFEWAEPNHDPMVSPNAPGYWQPDWVTDDVIWVAPYHELRKGTPREQRWRDREVTHYRVERYPAWDNGPVIVDAETGIIINETPGEPVSASVSPSFQEDVVTEHEGRKIRTDGLWTYNLRDRQRDANADGYLYTITSSTCADGPWSRPLELQYELPFAPELKRVRYSNVDADGHAPRKHQQAITAAWRYERGNAYELQVTAFIGDRKLFAEPFLFRHLELPGSGGTATVVISDLFVDTFRADKLVIRARVRRYSGEVVVGYGPWSEPLMLPQSVTGTTPDPPGGTGGPTTDLIDDNSVRCTDGEREFTVDGKRDCYTWPPTECPPGWRDTSVGDLRFCNHPDHGSRGLVDAWDIWLRG